MSDTAHEYSHRDRCGIVGVGSTEFSACSGPSTLALATDAAWAALDDAGLQAADVDGIVRCVDDVVLHNDLVQSLGIPNLTYWFHAGLAGTAPCAMIGQAVGAILSGQATTVLAYRSLNGRSGRRFGAGFLDAAERRDGGEAQGRYDEFFSPHGLTTPGQMYALIARRHMVEYGTTEVQLGHIAMACRAPANANPAAQMYQRPLDLDTYLAGRMIASPLRLFDFCLETDGACAVIVTNAERAADCRHKSVSIRAIAQGSGGAIQGCRTFPTLMRPRITSFPSRAVADTLCRRAGLGPQDVDVAQIYDCFTITVLIQLEDYGFCAAGEGGPLAQSGALDLGGSLPINTGGGHLSEGYIHGMNHLVEGVRQIGGTSTSQVEDAEVCLVTSGVPPASSALMLTRAA
jgi:acetyl-CoA acetyltransferase